MKVWKKAFEMALLVALLVSCQQQPALAQSERNKTIKKDFDAKSEMSVKHRYGPLTVKKSSDGKVHLEAELLIKGKNEEAMNAVFERFDVDVKEDGARLDIATALDIESWNTINGKTTIKFKDGAKVNGLSDVKAKMTLFVPDVQSLMLENKYDDIELADDFNGKLSVNLYSGKLIAKNLGGTLQLDMKYGKAELLNVGEAGMEIYDSEIKLQNAASLTISSKYSEFRIGDVKGDMKLLTYDEEWAVGSVGGKLTVDDKYSEFKFGNLQDAQMRLYDASFSANSTGALDIEDSKYSDYTIQSARSFQFRQSFDDEVKIEQAGSVSAGESKYTEYMVRKLEKRFALSDSYDDTAKIYEVAAGFQSIGLNGKYSDLEFAFIGSPEFQVEVETQYGSFEYPESKVDVRIYKEKDSKILLQGWVGPEKTTGDYSRVSIKGYDLSIVWR